MGGTTPGWQRAQEKKDHVAEESPHILGTFTGYAGKQMALGKLIVSTVGPRADHILLFREKNRVASSFTIIMETDELIALAHTILDRCTPHDSYDAASELH